MIKQESIDGLLNEVDVVEVIGDYIEIRRAGGNFKAVCPFHSDTTPSLMISPQKQIYKCFSCGAGGNAISFVMNYDHLSYPQSIEKLASKVNFTLQYSNQNNFSTSGIKVLEDLSNFYVNNLFQNPNAFEYVKQRGISIQSCKRFKVGLSLQSGHTLAFLRQNHFDLNEMVELGVLGRDGSRLYERFTNRLMFPIFSHSGKIVGFGGRTMVNHPAKYINSPETKLYNKSQLLYGFNLARISIHKTKRLIICEGYLDVVMLHQAGFEVAVASLGTALTPRHIPAIKKTKSKVLLCYDGDNAGVNAAFKACELLSKNDIDNGVVLMKEGLDPADMVQQGQVEVLKNMFNFPMDGGTFVLRIIAARFNLSNVYEKKECLGVMLGFLKSLDDFLASQYILVAANILSVSPNDIQAQLTKESSQRQNILSNVVKYGKKNNKSSSFENKTQTPIPTQMPLKTPQNDLQELSIIKAAWEEKANLKYLLEHAQADYFFAHKEEFLKLQNGSFTNEDMLFCERDCVIIASLNVEKEVALLQLRYLENIQVPQILNDKCKSFEQKSKCLQRIHEIINELKRKI